MFLSKSLESRELMLDPWNDKHVISFVLIHRWEAILEADELISRLFYVTSSFDKKGNLS